MNNQFQFVQNCQLNTSKSKQTYLFPKAPRFRPVKLPKYCSTDAAARNHPTTSPAP